MQTDSVQPVECVQPIDAGTGKDLLLPETVGNHADAFNRDPVDASFGHKPARDAAFVLANAMKSLERAVSIVRAKAAYASLALVLAIPLLFAGVSEGVAASSFGDMADNVKDELTRFGPLLQAAFALGGFFLVGLGLWQLWAKSQQPGAPKGGAIIAILIGCGLLGAATIAQMGSGTLGTGTPELSEIGL